MRKNKVYKEWLKKAEEDFGFANVSLKETKYYAQICFHFHQAAEKYLKAFIIANHLEFRPVHNLIELLNICKGKNHKIEELEEACRYLNPFYIDTRYPVHWPTQYDRETAVNAMKSAKKIRGRIKNALK
ncbi:MAG: HEPN domain-containing protein [Desulfobacterales bacterium]|nr:HEPN domain-containing protein [Desulfobacterales bacterium]